MKDLFVFNTLTRKKEKFTPFSPPFVGMYVCGPTVYSDAHLGHAKSYISFDVIYRYLMHLGFQVRYVQNITDVGHLTDNADEGEDKMLKQAQKEKIHPMQVAEKYTRNFFRDTDRMNVLRPDISPRATGHIPEQIEIIQKLLDKGYAYVVNGSVYFDVLKYSKSNHYGKLSGRKTDELLAATRELEHQEEKRSPSDFSLWKKATPSHILNWKSPWGNGYPGWHIECSAMSMKYLGETIDIHGGGLENQFPHHECEIAQSEGVTGRPFVRYWLHNNMVTLNGQKMGKSLGNSLFVDDIFSGNTPLLGKAFSPMTVRFLILQSHYRSTLDFSDESLLAAEKGRRRLLNGYRSIKKNAPAAGGEQVQSQEIIKLREDCYEAMNDDFNAPRVIAALFDGMTIFENSSLSPGDHAHLAGIYKEFLFDILGLMEETPGPAASNRETGLIEAVLEIRNEARKQKNFSLSDTIRDKMKSLGIDIHDKPEGATWTINE